MGTVAIWVTLLLAALSVPLFVLLAIRNMEAVLGTLAILCILATVASLVFSLINFRESGPLVILVQAAGIAVAGYMLWNHWAYRFKGRAGPSRIG